MRGHVLNDKAITPFLEANGKRSLVLTLPQGLADLKVFSRDKLTGSDFSMFFMLPPIVSATEIGDVSSADMPELLIQVFGRKAIDIELFLNPGSPHFDTISAHEMYAEAITALTGVKPYMEFRCPGKENFPTEGELHSAHRVTLWSSIPRERAQFWELMKITPQYAYRTQGEQHMHGLKPL